MLFLTSQQYLYLMVWFICPLMMSSSSIGRYLEGTQTLNKCFPRYIGLCVAQKFVKFKETGITYKISVLPTLVMIHLPHPCDGSSYPTGKQIV